MYANRVEPEVGDVVADPHGIGDVLEVMPKETGDVHVTVKWRKPANTAQYVAPAPAKSLTFLRRK